jgi:glycosyltransferase EpsF
MSEKKIKVLMVVSNLRPSNGVSSYAMNYFRKLDHDSVQMDFAVYKQHDNPYDDEIKANGGRVFVLPNIRKDFINHCKACKKLIKNEHYDIVHDNTMLVSYPIMHFARKSVPVRILHSHSSMLGETAEKSRRNKLFIPFLKLKSNFYVACSEVAGRAMFQNKHFDILPNVIDVNRFRYNPLIREKVRKELNIESKKVIITVGRIVNAKNPYFALDVFDISADKNPDIVYLWAGSGALDKPVSEYASGLKHSDRVILLGSRNDIPDLLQAADLFFLPSLFEGLPVTCIEAQANGLQCVISDSITKEIKFTDLLDYVDLNKSKTEWADLILDKISSDCSRNDYYDEAVKSNFSDINAGSRLESYYKSLLNQQTHLYN